jgi:hypothetical protein
VGYLFEGADSPSHSGCLRAERIWEWTRASPSSWRPIGSGAGKVLPHDLYGQEPEPNGLGGSLSKGLPSYSLPVNR